MAALNPRQTERWKPHDGQGWLRLLFCSVSGSVLFPALCGIRGRQIGGYRCGGQGAACPPSTSSAVINCVAMELKSDVSSIFESSGIRDHSRAGSFNEDILTWYLRTIYLIKLLYY